MATVNGYHLWALPNESAKEFEESIEFTELENDLPDGYHSQVLFGSNNGLRSFRLTLPTLAHTDVLPNTVTDINGADVSREEYIWNLFCETKVTGEPFVYQSRRNDQYYLVRFADKKLTYRGMLVKLYSTGIELKQVRVQNISVFDPANAGKSFARFDELGHSTNWNSTPDPDVISLTPLTKTGDVVIGTAPQNGRDIVRLNNTSNTGYLTTDAVSNVQIWDLFIVMKMREATFSNAAQVFCESVTTGVEYLRGTASGTKFQDTLGGSVYFEYRLNGTLYASTNMQAPMNTWGVVHCRFAGTGLVAEPIAADGFRFGASPGATPSGFAEIDIAEIQMYDERLPMSFVRELTEHLIVKWAATS